MPRPDGFAFLDYKTDGKLARLLRRWRKAGDSYEVIARRLCDIYDADVTASTVRRWCINLDVVDEAAS